MLFLLSGWLPFDPGSLLGLILPHDSVEYLDHHCYYSGSLPTTLSGATYLLLAGPFYFISLSTWMDLLRINFTCLFPSFSWRVSHAARMVPLFLYYVAS